MSERSERQERFMAELRGESRSAPESRVETLEHALRTLLEWAERYRGGDESLHVEEWYIARDYARIALTTEAALQRPTPECTCGWKHMHHPDCAASSPPTAACPPPEEEK